MIRLPVSIGEAVDKLTILDIKCEKIQDPVKRSYCQQEYDILFEELKSDLQHHAFYYKLLRDVNLQIWDMQDEIRLRPDPKKCVDILDKNDIRFRIKHLINTSVNSTLREQKGYAAKRAIVVSHLGLGDHIGMVGAVRYIALMYDETVVVCKHQNLKNVQSLFADNPSITVQSVSGDIRYGYPSKLLSVSTDGFDGVYLSGTYIYPNNGFDDLPSCFYRDMGLDPEIRHTHFYIPTTPEASDLYKKLGDQPYIFVQQKSSTHDTDLITWDIDSILTIDPNTNMYSPEHRWHDLAECFVNREFLSYKEVLQHAKEIHTIDSSFYCLACYIPLDATVKRCYARDTGVFIPTYNFT
jgi:hypothetical protein